MTERKLWNGVPALGLGCRAFGGPFCAGETSPGWGKVDDRESVGAIRRGLDLGIRFVDTANVYGAGHSEEVVGVAVGNRTDVIVCTKFGGRVAPGYAERLDAVRDLLRTGGRTLAQGALGWLWARSARTMPIPEFRSVGQVEENAGALTRGPLPARAMEEIEAALRRDPEGEPRER